MKIAYIAALAVISASAANAQTVNGPWAEARGGWDNSSGDGESSSGFLYGAAAGYDIGVGSKGFIGVQAGITGSTLNECDLGVCVSAGRDIEILARAGFAVAQQTSLYGLAGYSNGRVNFDSGALQGGVNIDGLRIGAGVEQQWGGRTFTKLEYRYTDYGSATVLGIDLGDAGNRHQVSASFGLRF